MKKLKLIPVFLFAAMALCFSTNAQTYKEKKTFYKASDERTHLYQNSKWHVVEALKEGTKTTTDSALYYIDTITVANNEAGILEVQVLGYNDSLSIGVFGKYIVRYKKVGGTLTLGTPAAVLTLDIDTGLQNTSFGGATWSIVAASNNIYVRIKGKNTYNIQWESMRFQQKFVGD